MDDGFVNIAAAKRAARRMKLRRALPNAMQERADFIAIVAEGVRAGLEAYDAAKSQIQLIEPSAAELRENGRAIENVIAQYFDAQEAAKAFREAMHQDEVCRSLKAMLRFLASRRGKSTSFREGAK